MLVELHGGATVELGFDDGARTGAGRPTWSCCGWPTPVGGRPEHGQGGSGTAVRRLVCGPPNLARRLHGMPNRSVHASQVYSAGIEIFRRRFGDPGQFASPQCVRNGRFDNDAGAGAVSDVLAFGGRSGGGGGGGSGVLGWAG